MLVAKKRDLVATRRCFTHALKHGSYPTEVNTDRAPAYVRVLDAVLPGACNIVEQYANNPVEADHGRLKARLRPVRGLKRLRSAQGISTGHALCRTYAAVTTNSAWISTPGIDSRRCSPASHLPSDHSIIG